MLPDLKKLRQAKAGHGHKHVTAGNCRFSEVTQASHHRATLDGGQRYTGVRRAGPRALSGGQEWAGRMESGSVALPEVGFPTCRCERC